MKKLYLSLILIFCLQIAYSQDTINILKDVIVIRKESNRKEMIAILKAIKYNLRENYEQSDTKYLTNHFVSKDNKDTLENRSMLNILNIKVLSKKNIQWMLNNSNKYFNSNISAYSRFEPEITEDHWFAFLSYYDSLNVIDFDFFNISNDYKYQISKETDITTVKFTSSRFHSGYFTFNSNNYNLIRIVFMNTKPYDFYVYGWQGNERHLEFTTKWNYNKKIIKLDFTETNKGKLLLVKLDAMEELTNFEFKRYNESKRIIDNGINMRFYSTLQMKIIN